MIARPFIRLSHSAPMCAHDAGFKGAYFYGKEGKKRREGRAREGEDGRPMSFPLSETAAAVLLLSATPRSQDISIDRGGRRRPAATALQHGAQQQMQSR